MSNYTKEYEELEKKFLSNEISLDEFLQRYNELKGKESDDMMNSDTTGDPHEHI